MKSVKKKHGKKLNFGLIIRGYIILDIWMNQINTLSHIPVAYNRYTEFFDFQFRVQGIAMWLFSVAMQPFAAFWLVQVVAMQLFCGYDQKPHTIMLLNIVLTINCFSILIILLNFQIGYKNWVWNIPKFLCTSVARTWTNNGEKASLYVQYVSGNSIFFCFYFVYSH